MLKSRRNFLRTSAALGSSAVFGASAILPGIVMADDKNGSRKLATDEQIRNQVGVTTSSFSGHLVKQPAKDKFTLLELPRMMRDELDMKVIDLNTSSLASYDPAYLDKVRSAADAAGCFLINLKMNQKGLDMNSPDAAVRNKALTEYKRSIDAASRLGLRWARPLPLKATPDMKIHVASYQELADYAAARNVQMLVENYAWMESDPQSVPKLIKAIGRNVAACPDTGNWRDNSIRYKALAQTFPLAVTCDFKARVLDQDGGHALYDLKRCFQVGHKVGYRGPWCLEHANRNRKALFRELGMLRDMLRKWMTEANA
jgi:hypothetical protein